MNKTLFLVLAVTLTVAINASAQLTPAAPANLPDATSATGNYAPGYTTTAMPLPDASSAPAAEAHVPESTTFIVGCIMLVPLGVSLVRVFRGRHVLP